MGKKLLFSKDLHVPYLLEKAPRRLLNFFDLSVRRLFEGGAYSGAALI